MEQTQKTGDKHTLEEPLLDKNNKNESTFAKASLISKLFLLWMNPLLSKGYKNPISIKDVPCLSPKHEPFIMSEMFESKWPKQDENCKNPVRTTLLRCFWKEVVFTAFLSVTRICAMYVGPILIKEFINFTSGVRKSPYEGYYLVLILLLATSVEVLSSHHFNFDSMKLGMLIRGCLITNLYKKGLKLTCSARQAHGVGQIVNYMSVDARQVSDTMFQLHAIWLMPFQIAVALALLYKYLGLTILVSFFGILCVTAFALLCTKKFNTFNRNVMIKRDSRMKATNEMLSNMRVIKFQAWEEHFKTRIESIRESEYKWLSKFLYALTCNVTVLWSSPILISVLTFGTAIVLGVKLDAGTVFTCMTIFKMLQEPIRSFRQSMISISQALVSLGRLGGFMMSRELAEEAVESVDACGGDVAVGIKDGWFCWEDDGGEEILKGVNVDVKKGELAAVVGTVGSGKLSLLASVLGEMHKIRGKA